MKCSNNHCYWNYDGQCCPESEEQFNNATPNELDCPSSLRRDHEESLYQLVDEITVLLNKRNMKELIQIKNFIELQREKDYVKAAHNAIRIWPEWKQKYFNDLLKQCT